MIAQEYCMGNTSTKFGALRASHGHPEPFQIKYAALMSIVCTVLTWESYVEIGNEDFFSSTYNYRVI